MNINYTIYCTCIHLHTCTHIHVHLHLNMVISVVFNLHVHVLYMYMYMYIIINLLHYYFTVIFGSLLSCGGEWTPCVSSNVSIVVSSVFVCNEQPL